MDTHDTDPDGSSRSRAARRPRRADLHTLALEATANGVVITDRAGQIEWVNPAFSRLTGYRPAEIIGQQPRVLKSGSHDPHFYRVMWETILSGQVWQGEMVNRRKDGSTYVEEQTITPVRGADGTITHFIAIKQDVSERKRQEEQLHRLATHDALTDLPNRRALVGELARVLAGARQGQPAALLLLDLDNFKLVNDTLGHQAGDQLLAGLARMLSRNLRRGDFLARLGGDEFCVLLRGVTLGQSRAVAEHLRQEVEEFRFGLDGYTFAVAMSVGVVPIDGTLGQDAIFAQADLALYREKGVRKSRIAAGTVPKAEGALALQWVPRILDALNDDGFVLHFQPVVSLKGGQTHNFETLIRMRGQGEGLIPPAEFLPVAQRFGLMPRIDRWVMHEALNLLAARPDLRLFVNLCGADLSDDPPLQSIEAQILAGGDVASRLVLEITETTAIAEIARAPQWMWRLKELGCRFALDDFGQGFASFTHLRALPVDYVKISGSFICNLDRDPTNQTLVQCIATAAHALGKVVIAEWVETEPVAQILRRLGVEYGQGFLWGLPGSQPTPPG